MFISAARRRLHRTGRTLAARRARGTSAALRLGGVACLAACTSAAVAIPAGAAVQAPGMPAARFFYLVTNLNNAGGGSLRQAILNVNANRPGARLLLIRFSVHGVITLRSPLPAVTRSADIDATSAPTHVKGGPPVVEINGNRNGGLRFARGSGGSYFEGLAVDNASGNGITLNAGKITLDNDYVGLNLAGAPSGNRGDGVYASRASSGNQIGLNPARATGVVANVISGNWGSGLVLAGSSRNTVVSNRIGTNPAGTSAIRNGRDGIAITGGSDGNEIGGTAFVDPATGQANNPTGDKGTVTPVFVVPPLGNQVSGNGAEGVLIASGSRGNVLNGNFIGTTSDGDGAIGNGGDGVWINGASNNSLIGCKFVNSPFVYYNVVSGNRGDGLRLTNANNAVVQGNFFGSAANNSATVSNRLDGIRLDGSSANDQIGGVIPLGNVSAGNGRNGIDVAGRVRGFITFNTFGGLHAFGGAAPNRNDGLLVTSTGGNNLARTNVFSGNTRNGIEISGRAWGVTVDPDIAGAVTDGNAPLPNGGDGVLIDGAAHDNVIGGSRRSVIPQNTLSGNAGYGLAIIDRAHDNRVFNSFIGPAILGVKPLGNQRGGVLIAGTAYGNSIGNLTMRPSDLISANRGVGLTLLRGTRGNRVINNYIGLDRFGRRLPNSRGAVVNLGRGNTFLGNRYQ